jgi:hypothetical protein
MACVFVCVCVYIYIIHNPPSYFILFIPALTCEFISLSDETVGFMLGSEAHAKITTPEKVIK